MIVVASRCAEFYDFESRQIVYENDSMRNTGIYRMNDMIFTREIEFGI